MSRIVQTLVLVVIGSVAPLLSAVSQPVFSDGFEQRVVFETLTVAGAVILPPSSTIDPDTLTVENAFQVDVPVNAGGAFSLLTGDAPQLAMAVQSNGDTLLMGWFGVGYDTLSTRTTAEVLLYYYLGASFTHPFLYRQIIDRIPNDVAVLDQLEAVIAAELTNDPSVLENGSAAIVQALNSAVDTILTDALSGKSVPTRKGVRVTPSDSQSGLDIIQEFQSVRVQNNRRRPAYAYLERTVCRGSSSCPPLAHEFSISSITGITSLAAGISEVGRMIAGLTDELPLAYTPTSSDREPLPLLPGATEIDYRLTVVGAGLMPGDFGLLTPAQQTKAREINLQFVVQDLLIPFLLNVLLPANGERLNQLYGNESAGGIVGDVSNLLLGNSAFASAIQNGQFQQAFRIGAEAVLTSGSLRNRFIELVFEGVAVRNGPGLVRQYLDRAARAVAVLGVVDGVLATFDLTVAGSALGSSDAANIWTLTVTPVPVTLTARQPNATCTQNAEFEATLTDQPDAEVRVRYRFTMDPPGAGQLISLDEPGVSSLTELVTSGPNIEFSPFATAGRDSVDIKVEVEAFEGNRSGPIGEATSTANVQRPLVELTPRLTSIQDGQTVDLTASLRDSNNNTEGCTDGVAPRFIWNSTTSAGNIDVIQGLLLDRETVTYTADSSSDGADTVTVEAYLSDILIGQDTAEVRVEEQPSVVFGSLVIDTQSDDVTACVNATVAVPVVNDATRFNLRAYGGYDPFFWGTSVNDSAPPFDNGFGITYTQEDRRMGLSAGCGGAENAADTQAWLEGRFGSGWVWEILVTY
ncbi:MAG: hypothetical protein QNJ40_09805 [Xanthomonadales bacterium]|nr:hypothetical protein [Xanthomonadales bacterium]